MAKDVAEQAEELRQAEAAACARVIAVLKHSEAAVDNFGKVLALSIEAPSSQEELDQYETDMEEYTLSVATSFRFAAQTLGRETALLSLLAIVQAEMGSYVQFLVDETRKDTVNGTDHSPSERVPDARPKRRNKTKASTRRKL